MWAGVLLHVLPEVGDLEAASSDATTGVIGVVGAALLTGAALWLEQVCRVPPSSEDDGPAGGVRA